MKKNLIFIISILLCMLLLASCGVGSNSEGVTENNQGDNSTDKDNNNDDTPDDDYVVNESETPGGEVCIHVPKGAGTVVEPSFEGGGYTEYTCSECGEKFKDQFTAPLPHNYSSEWSFDMSEHWNACTDEGYAQLKGNVAEHTLVDEIITDSTSETTGLMKSTCSVCKHSFESVIPRKTHIVSLPTVDESRCLVGMPLSMVELVGGEGSVAGSFSWCDPEARLSEAGSYEIYFTPSDPEDAVLTATVQVSARWLTINVSAGSNGEASIVGGNKVRYGDDATVNLIPRFGYEVNTFMLDGSPKSCETSYIIENITTDKTVSVTFKRSDSAVSVDCISGSQGCYSISGGTLTISGISADTVYSISGEAFGNIVINVDPAYKFELELKGFRLTSVNAAPITVINGDKVTISAKKSYTNYITDLRPAVSGNDPSTYPAAIYSLIDLDIEGKGSLTVRSDNNGGIYSKKDVEVKNLTLTVNASENALRGNDSVTLTGGSTTLIATRGDAVKTTNSDISSKGNQRGNVTVTGGVHNIYAAGDGISAAHDVIISDSTTTLNIYTDAYSSYTLLETVVSEEKMYIRTTSKDYSYSIKFSKKDGSFEWSDATYVGEYFIGEEVVHIYEVTKKFGYTHIAVYAYTSNQTQGQDVSYHLTTYDIPINKGYDTIAIKDLTSALGFRYTSLYLNENGNTVLGERSNRGIKAANLISISGGSISVSSHGDALKANNDAILENGSSPSGDINISGGSITVTTYSTGVLAEGDLTISGGSVTINSSFIGLSGDTVTTLGASTSIIATYKPTNIKQ